MTTRRSRDAAGPRRLDVVALHRLQQVHPHEPDQHPADQQAERDRGQDQVLRARPRTRPVAGDQGVDQIEVGDLVELELDHRAGAARARQPAELVAEQELGQEAGEEDRRRVDHDPEQSPAEVDRACRGSGPRASPIGIPTTSATANAARVSSSVAVPFSTMIEVTVAVVVDRRPEVERERVADVLDVLLEQRLVEPGGLARWLELLRRDASAERRLRSGRPAPPASAGRRSSAGSGRSGSRARAASARRPAARSCGRAC